MVVRSDGVILVDKGIQLKRCARHSSAREQIYSLSVSRMGIGWFNNLAALGLCNRLLNRSPKGKKHSSVINQGDSFKGCDCKP